MSIDIYYKGLWTYNITIPPRERKKTEKKLPLTCLNEKDHTHIHGELQIIIDNRIVPKLGINSSDDVCIGYWIEMLAKLFKVFDTETQTYTIEGGEQGKPAYKFEKEGNNVFLSIVDSMLGGKGDPNWQRVKFNFGELKVAYKRFKVKLLEEISMEAPNVVDYWSRKFL